MHALTSNCVGVCVCVCVWVTWSHHSNLEVIDVRTNFLHFLPSSFAALDRLQEVYAANNLLEAFPHEIAKMPYLHTVDLSKNRLVKRFDFASNE